MRNSIFTLLGILLFTIVGCAQESNSEAEELAIASAQSWLEIVDAEKYIESWEESAELFKSAISKVKWVESIQVVRNPLGKVILRRTFSVFIFDSFLCVNLCVINDVLLSGCQ